MIIIYKQQARQQQHIKRKHIITQTYTTKTFKLQQKTQTTINHTNRRQHSNTIYINARITTTMITKTSQRQTIRNKKKTKQTHMHTHTTQTQICIYKI